MSFNNIGSAGSLVNEDDDEDQVVHEELPPFSEADFAPVAIFLAGLGMEDWISVFKKEDRILEKLESLLKENHISQELFERLKPTGSQPPRLYGLAKVHKENTPMRPVLSMPGSAYYNVAKPIIHSSA